MTGGIERSAHMLHIVESRKPLDRVAKDLEEAAGRHRFGVLGVHDLKATMAKKGVDFSPECRIFEVCNPHQAKKVLEANLEISTALPCRISLYAEGRAPGSRRAVWVGVLLYPRHPLPTAAAPVLVAAGLARHAGVFALLPVLAAFLAGWLLQLGGGTPGN